MKKDLVLGPGADWKVIQPERILASELDAWHQMLLPEHTGRMHGNDSRTPRRDGVDPLRAAYGRPVRCGGQTGRPCGKGTGGMKQLACGSKEFGIPPFPFDL